MVKPLVSCVGKTRFEGSLFNVVTTNYDRNGNGKLKHDNLISG